MRRHSERLRPEPLGMGCIGRSDVSILGLAGDGLTTLGVRVVSERARLVAFRVRPQAGNDASVAFCMGILSHSRRRVALGVGIVAGRDRLLTFGVGS